MNTDLMQSSWRREALERAEILPLFPTLVWKTQLAPAVAVAVNRLIKNYLHGPAADLGVGEAWQSGHDFHRLAGLEPLAECIKAAAGDALETLKVAPRDIEITACWATINAPGRGHAAHVHPNSFLSAVYYVETRAGADTINFHDPRIQPGIIRPPVTRLVAANADQAVVRVSDGTLLLFPSWLQHSVDPNASQGNRISVSFNVMFSAYTERLCKPLWAGGEQVSKFVPVAKVSEIADQSAKCVEVAGKRIALFNLGGEFYALGDDCTHEGGPLSEGEIHGEEVECPWHGAHFNIKSGKVTLDPAAEDVDRYNVRITGDDIEIEI